MNIKRMVAPIIVTMILIAYFLCFIFHILNDVETSWMRVIGIIIAFMFIGISIYYLIERIKEIRSGEYDDLGKY